MKKIIPLVVLLLILAILGGVAMADRLVTADRLLTYTGLTAAEVDAEALPELIRRFSLTEDAMKQVPPEELAEELLEVLATPYQDNFSYLFSSPDVIKPPAKIDIGTVKHIAVYDTIEVLHETAFYDFENGKVYSDKALLFLDNIGEAENQTVLTEEVRAGVAAILDTGNWDQWKPDYAGDTSGYVGTINYGIAIETEDGIIRVVISGISDDVPTAVSEVVSGLLTLSVSES